MEESNIFSILPPWAWQPYIFFPIATLVFAGVMVSDRALRVISTKTFAIIVALLGVLIFVLGARNETFYLIIAKGDNVPIIMMLYLLGFFTWLAFRCGTQNDDRIAAGKPPIEDEEAHQKVMVWPDLVYTEFICLILVTLALLVWSIVLKAPLEQPATRVDTPNPSKAPWYFLGLQELLVYFDPWIAGVVLPGLVIVGLIAIPYIDINPKGQGYYTIAERRFAISMFLYGFLIMWVMLIFVGTFLRGPNWNIFPLGDVWDVHKIEVLNNVNLSEYIWVSGLGQPLPSHWFLRELPGMILVGAYFAICPGLLAFTIFKRFWNELGFVRYSIMVGLFLSMAFVVVKMVLRWSFNLKYFVAIPEHFFNI